jgi:GDP-D-mannose 3',5'-epimerase
MGKRYIVTGAGGFVGHHLVKRLKADGHYVRGVDIKHPHWSKSPADEFVIADLRTQDNARQSLAGGWDGLFMLAADMGGLGYMESATTQASIAYNNTLINTHTLYTAAMMSIPRVVYTSSAVVYPDMAGVGKTRMGDWIPAASLSEDMAHPADPQEGMYGWNKLYTEHMCHAFELAYPMSCRVVRLHNCYGPEGAWDDGREKAPAALCRKVAQAVLNGDDHIEVWGDGLATRSFMHINDGTKGLMKIMDCEGHLPPLNLGSSEMISINSLAKLIMTHAGVDLEIRHVDGPVGVQGRNSDNSLILQHLGWEPQTPIHWGVGDLYQWIEQQVAKKVAH